MSESHLQTRTLTDAIDRVDTLLATRRTRLEATEERRSLASYFAPHPQPDFESWAFSASEYQETTLVIKKHAPELLGHIEEPLTDRDFTVVGHCSLDLQFAADPNGAESVRHTLHDGTQVRGARVTSAEALLYSSGLVNLPTIDRRNVYLFQPAGPREGNAAQVASSIFRNRGKTAQMGLTVTFPQAQTANLPEYGWVTQLKSEDGLYVVRNFVNSGEAILSENGFFARETQVIQMTWFCMPEEYRQVIIDGPFVAFFADDTGIHAAAWFDHDSFTQAD